eukprot:COSAG04_NODE_1_length_58448_cov_23.476478_29_plen_217_part_00
MRFLTPTAVCGRPRAAGQLWALDHGGGRQALHLRADGLRPGHPVSQPHFPDSVASRRSFSTSRRSRIWNRGIVFANDAVEQASFQELGSPNRSLDIRGVRAIDAFLPPLITAVFGLLSLGSASISPLAINSPAVRRRQDPGYGVYQESRRSKNYFGGGTGLGTVTEPQATLDVGGDLRLRGDATVHLDAATPDGDGKATNPSSAVAHGLVTSPSRL